MALVRNTQKEFVEQLLEHADIKIGGDRPWDITVHDERFYNRVLRDGSLGAGESYMEGWWDSAALDETVSRVIRANIENKVRPSLSLVYNMIRAYVFNTQDRKRCKSVIDLHYELGNDLYQNMLDPTMAYSCGYWKNATTLYEAQIAKFDLIAKKLGITKGMRVLDIGCGWGGFAKHLAENYGAHVVGITLSKKQAEYAAMITKGLPVEIRIKDYRDMDEMFDRIVSIGMFEHVGVKNYRFFMQTVHRCLENGGLSMLHTIGVNKTSLVTDVWISKYIFPEAVLPSISMIGKSIEDFFVMEDWHNLNVDYEKTLLAWYRNFDANWPKLKANYPDPFYRMWKYYLHACAGMFRARQVQLWQIVLSKRGILNGYQSIR